jgi:uncharacterized protein
MLMPDIKNQPKYFVAVFEIDEKYKTIADIMAKWPEALTEHLARSNRLHKEGKVIMAGAFSDRPDEPLTTMSVFYTKEDADEFAKGDPFVLNGAVVNWYVREWGNILSA